jgi:hypothetical protein
MRDPLKPRRLIYPEGTSAASTPSRTRRLIRYFRAISVTLGMLSTASFGLNALLLYNSNTPGSTEPSFENILISLLENSKTTVVGGRERDKAVAEGALEFSSHRASSRIPLWRQTGNSSTEALLTTTLPVWMQTYMDWHVETRANLTSQNWNSTRYIYISCLASDTKCGGASDRLQLLPWAVLMAARGNRLLLIRWERPCALEEFLVPKDVDWTVPEWLWQSVQLYSPHPKLLMSGGKPSLRHAQAADLIVAIRQQAHDHGKTFYDELKEENEAGFYEVFHDVWKAFFQPSPIVQIKIEKTMDDLGLRPRRYIAAHVRQKYHRDKTHDTDHVDNAVRCAYQSRQGASNTIYFASDSTVATKRAVDFGRYITALANDTVPSSINVVARINVSDPLHLDRGSAYLQNTDSWQSFKPDDFYDVFVDLYLLASSTCVVYGVGGYGLWASLLTTKRCSFRHSSRHCGWEVPSNGSIAHML